MGRQQKAGILSHFYSFSFFSIKLNLTSKLTVMYTVHGQNRLHDYKEMNSRKTVPERWWNIYLNDDGCKEELQRTSSFVPCMAMMRRIQILLCSIAGNKHYQLENLEFSSDDSLFNDTISSCMWNDGTLRVFRTLPLPTGLQTQDAGT